MNSTRLADQVNYDPNNLLDALIEKLNLKNDAALSRALEVAPPVISKIRHRRLPVGASLLMVDSEGNLELADNQGDIAGRLGLVIDRPVRVRPA